MIDCLTFTTEMEAVAAVTALRSKGHRAEWFYSKTLGCYVVPL